MHSTTLLFYSGILGLIIGSFLNVVIYRLPIMLQKNWQQQCAAFLNPVAIPAVKKFDLVLPASHCPYCKKSLVWWMNIPVLSYILLRGKCAYCKTKLSLRYPTVEVLTALLTLFIALHFGWHRQTIAAWIFTWGLLALIFIDIKQQLLPDEITLGLLWLGLLISLANIFINPYAAILGAVGGYIFLFSIGWLFQKFRGIEGIGYGDYKLFAALGAWLGWQRLLLVLLIASILGASIGLILIWRKKIHYQTPLPFGPYLALAGWIVLCYGQELMQAYSRFIF